MTLRTLLPYLHLACAGGAAALWFLELPLGGWPLVLVALPWVAQVALGKLPPLRSANDKWLAIFLATAAVGVWTAHNRETAWAKFWLLVGAVALYYAFLVGRTQIERFHRWGLVGFGVLVAGYFLLTHSWDAAPTKVALVENFGRNLRTILPALNVHTIHPNVIAGLLLISLPFAIVSTHKRQTRWLGIAAASLLLIALVLTISRGAWIAVAAMATTAGLSRFIQHTSLKPAKLIAAALLAALLGVGLTPLLASTKLQQILPLNQSRLRLFREGLILANDYLFTGAGLGNFDMLHASYAFLTHVPYAVHGHNLALDLVIEQGFVSLLAICMLVVLTSATLWRVETLNLTQWAATYALLGSLVHAITDDALYSSGGVLLLFVPFVFITDTAMSTRISWRPALIISAVFAIVLLVIWRPLLATWHANVGAVRQAQLELSLYSWPDSQLQDQTRREVDLSPAITRYERALAVDPNNGTANRRLGQIQLSLAQYEAALAHLAAVGQQRTQSNTARQLYGEALIATGAVEQGRKVWASVHNEQNQLETRARWYGLINDSVRMANINEAIR